MTATINGYSIPPNALKMNEAKKFLFNLYQVRGNLEVGLTPNCINILQSQVLNPLREGFLRTLGNAQVTTDELLDLSNATKDRYSERRCSAPKLTSLFIIDQFCRPLDKRSLLLLRQADFSNFCIWFDVSCGIRSVATRILVAENLIRSGEESAKELLYGLEEHQGQPLPLNKWDEYLEALKASASQDTNLLIEDPTGCKLISEYTRRVVQQRGYPPPILSFQIPPLVTFGAEVSRDIYFKVYPLAKDVLNRVTLKPV